MDLSIIIVNYMSLTYLKKCIASICKNTSDIGFEIVVVDNNSQDECEDYVKTVDGKIKFIQSGRNLGFAGANNLGYRNSSGKYLLFLNPDTELIDSSINTMYNIVTENEHMGFVGCKLLNSDFSVQMSSIQAFPTIVNQSLDADCLRKFVPRLRLWGISPLLEDNEDPVEVDVISGACMMIRRDIFETIGMFSRDYFMYAEDLDLCFKAKKAGFKIYYTSKAAIIHHGGQSASQDQVNFNSVKFMRESMLIFFRKTRGSVYASFYKITTAACALSRLSVLAVLRPISLLCRGSGRVDTAFSKWKTIFRWAVNFER